MVFGWDFSNSFPIVVKAALSDAAAKTVIVPASAGELVGALVPHALQRATMAVSPNAPTTLARIARSVPGQLDDHVRGLDDRDRAHPGREAKLIGRLTGD